MNTEKVKQTTDQITAAYALNLWTVSISQIIDYNDVNVLEQEYETIMNNLNLYNMPKDEALLDVIKEIMEEITFLRISEGDKKIVEREYQHKLKDAVWSAVPNVGAIFATANPVAMGVTLATQVGIGYMNYRRNRADYELENERTKWQIQRNRMEHLHALQKQLFETAWRMTDAHKFEDRFRLTETQISDYDKALMQANPVKRFNDLDAMKSNYEAYPAFWYQIGSTANSIYLNEKDAELKEYYREKALDCFKRYDDLNRFNLLRHDVITAAWALEYLELQGLSDKERPEEARRLIAIAEKHAGNALDVLELCAFSYLRIRDYENAIRLFHVLVNKDYNIEINTQILSGLYIKEMFSGKEEAVKRARLGYKQLPSITDEKYIIPVPPEGTDMSQWSPAWNKEESFDDFVNTIEAEQRQEQLAEAKKTARPFYQRPILIVSDSDLETESEYFMAVLNENKNKIDPSLPTPSRTTPKEYKKHREEYEWKGTHIIFLGKSHDADTLLKAKNKKWDHDDIGIRFATLGNKTVVYSGALKNKEIDQLVALAKKYPVTAPQGVGTISYTFLKDTLGAPKLDATDTIATALAAIIGSPLLVIGQALEQAENTIQGISNLSARKKMEYLKYCLAILQYLESENALVE